MANSSDPIKSTAVEFTTTSPITSLNDVSINVITSNLTISFSISTTNVRTCTITIPNVSAYSISTGYVSISTTVLKANTPFITNTADFSLSSGFPVITTPSPMILALPLPLI